MDLGLEGRVALVTGGSKGIGRAIAAGLVDEGARVAVASRSAEGIEEAATAVGAPGAPGGHPSSGMASHHWHHHSKPTRIRSCGCQQYEMSSSTLR